MIDIKNNIDNMWIYFPENENDILNEVSTLTSFQFYDRYLLELSAREFLDFFQYLCDYKINNEFDESHAISQLINYGFGYKSDKSHDNQPNDFSFFRDRVEKLKSEHFAERINSEKNKLGLNINCIRGGSGLHERL